MASVVHAALLTRATRNGGATVHTAATLDWHRHYFATPVADNPPTRAPPPVLRMTGDGWERHYLLH